MSDTAVAVNRDWQPAANPWLIAVVVTLAAFMEVLDTTIVNVALPHIAGTMSASTDESTWTLTSYLVANGIVLPISGYLTRLIGRKRYFVICIAMFTLCSFLCGVATSLPQLIIFRLLQGFFGGGLQPNQQSIILDTFKPAQRGKAFGVVAIATIVAPVMGPTLGGWITDNFSWRWIFLINVPVGIFALFSVMQFVEDPPWLKSGIRRATMDYTGLGFIVLGLGSLQIVLDRGEDADWFQSGFICVLSAMALTGIIGGIYWLLYAKNPIVNLRVLGDRNFAVGCLMIFVMAFVLYSSAVLLPQLAQQQLGYDATWAGLILTPGAFMLIFMIPVIGRVMPLVQTRYMIAFGLFIMGCAFIYAHNISPTVNFATLVKMRAFQTLGLGFLFVPITTIAYSTLPNELNGDAAALFTMFRNLAGSIGISVATALITTRSQVRMAYLSEHLSILSQPYINTLAAIVRAGRATGLAADAAQQTATGVMYRMLIGQSEIQAYIDVFGFCAILAFAAVPLTFLFAPIKASRGKGGGH
jgi:DHA2 family multidrug resistance protein